MPPQIDYLYKKYGLEWILAIFCNILLIFALFESSLRKGHNFSQSIIEKEQKLEKTKFPFTVKLLRPLPSEFDTFVTFFLWQRRPPFYLSGQNYAQKYSSKKLQNLWKSSTIECH
eukprot:Pgem_evm1s15505